MRQKDRNRQEIITSGRTHEKITQDKIAQERTNARNSTGE
jgi:hypothetical protein